MKVVVILQETDFGDSVHSTVYGVYKDLKEFYDEAEVKGYMYDSINNFYYTTVQDLNIHFIESVETVKGIEE